MHIRAGCVAISALAALAACSSGSREVAPRPTASHSSEALSNSPSGRPPQRTVKPTLYTAVGVVEGYPSTHPRFCLTGDFAMTFDLGGINRDPCTNEIVLRNFDPRETPMTASQAGGSKSKGTVRVTGTYAEGSLTLTRPPVAAKPSEPVLTFPLPCRTPVGGWHGSDPVNVSQADEAVMSTFAAEHRATFGGWWLARAPAPVIVAGVTSDAAGAQLELSSKLQGDVCVTKVAHTDQYLTSVVNAITRLAMANKHLYLSRWGPSAVTSTVDVGVRIADQATIDYFAARFPPGVINLKPFLKPVP